jgi:hypothetical protein
MSGEIAHQWLGSPVHPGIREQCAEECQLLEETDNRILFRTSETVEGGDGTVNSQGIEVLLQNEDDGKWRVVQEGVLQPPETVRDGLIPQLAPVSLLKFPVSEIRVFPAFPCNKH